MSITLRTLEQAVARRTGPFFQAAQDATTPTTSTTIAAYMPTLRSSALLGGPENLFVLRRGVRADGTNTPNPIIADDRIRMVLSFDSDAGRVVVDRNWRDPMQPNEQADFVHLHPLAELHEAVMAGLRRCFQPDNVLAQPTAPFGGIDLTAQWPWLSEPWQVQRVRYGWTAPWGDAPFDTYTDAGHLILTGTSGYDLPTSVWVDCWRPAWSWVNGAESITGPVLDTDLLDVDLDYAAAAGHIEAWHNFPSRMLAAAAAGTQSTQQMAATEFSRQSAIFGPSSPRALGFQTVVRIGGHSHSWVNGPAW